MTLSLPTRPDPKKVAFYPNVNYKMEWKKNEWIQLPQIFNFTCRSRFHVILLCEEGNDGQLREMTMAVGQRR